MLDQENLAKSFNTITKTLSQHLDKDYTASYLIELVLIGCIALFSHFVQKTINQRYLNYLVKKEKTTTLRERLFYSVIYFSKPLIAFLLLLVTMSVSSIFTYQLEMYHLAINLTMIWFVCIFAMYAIPDFFVRAVVFCTLIPFLIFNALGISEPVLDYLDSLGFNVAGVNFSIFLILKTLLTATFLFWLVKLISRSVTTLIDSQISVDIEVRDLLQTLFQIILYATATFITFDIVGFDLKSFAMIGGAIGIGIGLGLQKIAANFISGVIVLFEQNIKVGHLVEIDGMGKPGWIRHLGARAAVVDTGDGKALLIPNEELLTKTVIDWTSYDRKIRTDLYIKVCFKSNLEKAKSIIVQAATSHPICSKKNPPTCYLEKFTDNGAEFLLQFWVDDLSVGKMDMQNDVLLYIWKRFAEENIEHPFPSDCARSA
jgi:small-conductance mechanosensitive channel